MSAPKYVALVQLPGDRLVVTSSCGDVAAALATVSALVPPGSCAFTRAVLPVVETVDQFAAALDNAAVLTEAETS